jgi:homoserine O-acetyltransferase/O-succinyltransferase
VASFHAGNVVLRSGITLPDVELVYETHGRLSAARDNVVVFPTCYDGTHEDNEFLIGPGRALDPERWFVVVPNMLGNGLSTSPSNAPEPVAGASFPLVTHADNVELQARLLRERFEVERVQLALGWSMGGQQAYHWAAMYPDCVERIAVICGAARTAPHTYVFLEGMRAALCAGSTPEQGLRAIARGWAGWALSQAWYRRAGWEREGYETVEDFLVSYWEAMYLRANPPNLVAQLRTWQACDVGEATGAGYEAAMRAIAARALLMPGRTDLYFPPEDSEAEAALLSEARLAVIPSDWGHYAGGGHDPGDVAFIDGEVARLLEV